MNQPDREESYLFALFFVSLAVSILSELVIVASRNEALLAFFKNFL